MDWSVFIVFLAATGAAAATGAMFSPGEWYKRIAKPNWTPPDWLFPIAWTALYLASAYAATRIAGLEGSALAMAFWAMQIAFNTLWSPIFFGLHRIGAAMVALVGLWIAVVGTFWTFLQLDLLAGLLIAPYVIWGTYAGALNLAILRMNRGGVPAGA